MRRTVALMTLSIALTIAAAANELYAAEPAKAKPEMAHVATCRDGKEYYHATGEKRGACSGHGGVAAWVDGSPVRGKSGGKTAYR